MTFNPWFFLIMWWSPLPIDTYNKHNFAIQKKKYGWRFWVLNTHRQTHEKISRWFGNKLDKFITEIMPDLCHAFAESWMRSWFYVNASRKFFTGDYESDLTIIFFYKKQRDFNPFCQYSGVVYQHLRLKRFSSVNVYIHFKFELSFLSSCLFVSLFSLMLPLFEQLHLKASGWTHFWLNAQAQQLLL